MGREARAGRTGRPGPRSQATWVGAMAAGGVLATHLLTFALLAPGAHARADLLARTGHGWFTAAGAVGIALAAAAATRFCVAAWRAGPSPAAPIPVGATAARLASAQAAGWVVLEAAERITHPGAHWAPRAFVLGLAVQAAVAFAAAVLLRLLHRGVAAVARWSAARRRFAVPRAPRRPAVGVVPSPRPAVLAGAAGVRGPPRS